MKTLKYILILLALLIGCSIASAQMTTQTSLLVNVQSSTFGGPKFTVLTTVSDQLSKFDAGSVDVGDKLYVLDGSECYELTVDSILTALTSILEVRVVDSTGLLANVTTGQAILVKPYANKGVPFIPSGTRSDLASCILQRIAGIIDSVVVTGGADGNGIYSGSGSLAGNTLITANASQLSINGTNLTGVLEVTNAASGNAIRASSGTGTAAFVTSGATAVWGNSTGSSPGIYGSSNTGTGVSGASTTGVGGAFEVSSNASTSTVIPIVNIGRYTPGTPLAGLGASISFLLKATNGFGIGAGSLQFKWSNPTSGAQSSEFEVVVSNNAVLVKRLGITAAGQIQAPAYAGAGISGTVNKYAAFDINGNIISTDAPSGSSTGDSNCSYTIYKAAHGWTQGTPIRWNGSTWVSMVGVYGDSLVADLVVTDSVHVDTVYASACGIYDTSLPDGDYFQTDQSPGFIEGVADTINVVLFSSKESKLIVNPVLGFSNLSALNLVPGTGINISGTYPNITIENTGALSDKSTVLEQDSVLISYTDNVETGRDTIKLVEDYTRVEQDSIVVYYQNAIEVGRDTIRTASGSGTIDGGGTLNYVAKWTGAETLGDALITDNGTRVTVLGTEGVVVPSGTTAERGANVTGKLRINTSNSNALEWYNGTSWEPIPRTVETTGLGTDTRIPFYDANGRLTTNSSVVYASSTLKGPSIGANTTALKAHLQTGSAGGARPGFISSALSSPSFLTFPLDYSGTGTTDGQFYSSDGGNRWPYVMSLADNIELIRVDGSSYGSIAGYFAAYRGSQYNATGLITTAQTGGSSSGIATGLLARAFTKKTDQGRGTLTGARIIGDGTFGIDTTRTIFGVYATASGLASHTVYAGYFSTNTLTENRYAVYANEGLNVFRRRTTIGATIQALDTLHVVGTARVTESSSLPTLAVAGRDTFGTFTNVSLGTGFTLDAGVLNFTPTGGDGVQYDDSTIVFVTPTQLADSLAAAVSGSGTLNTVPKWTPDGTTLGNSLITDDGARVSVGGTASVKVPVGTTAERSGTPIAGETRVNSTNSNTLEWYTGTAYEVPVRAASTTGLGTSGHVLFNDANGRATGSANLFWDNTNTRLGIGTNSPAQGLDIRSRAASFNLGNYTGTTIQTAVTGAPSGTAANIYVNTASQYSRYVGAYGNTAFGAYDVVFKSRTTNGSTYVNSQNGDNIYTSLYAADVGNSSWGVVGNFNVNIDGAKTGNGYWPGNMQWSVKDNTSTEAFATIILKSSRRFGILTDDPQQTLHVAGKIRQDTLNDVAQSIAGWTGTTGPGVATRVSTGVGLSLSGGTLSAQNLGNSDLTNTSALRTYNIPNGYAMRFADQGGGNNFLVAMDNRGFYSNNYSPRLLIQMRDSVSSDFSSILVTPDTVHITSDKIIAVLPERDTVNTLVGYDPTAKQFVAVERQRKGSVSENTDANGDVAVSATMPNATFVVTVQVTGTTLYHAVVHDKSTSGFKVRLFDSTGTVLPNATAVTFDYTLIDN